MLQLEALGYRFDDGKRIWSRPDYGGIAYSDGDTEERRLADIIGRATDLSVLSSELRQHCTDWMTLYHLSSQRANVLRPFEPFLNGQVLEIGAGCGAISRYLGEVGAQVLSLEGSPRRAAIAASRTRDLGNVTLLAERFDDFDCDEQFDVVTLIGVLEYASMFSASQTPALCMLEKMRRMLKPGGRLIIAIENQLGLKYFAGAPEDHIGEAMYGIEGRYRPGQPQTYGRQGLKELLTAAGYAGSEFLAPLPDYKLPRFILTEQGCAASDFDAAALAWQSAGADPQLPPEVHFDLGKAWPVIFDNGLGLEMANSFIVVATPEEQQSTVGLDQILAFHYSTERDAAFCKETRFVRDSQGKVSVHYHLLGDRQPPGEADYRLVLPQEDGYVRGRLLSQGFIELFSTPGWSIAQFADLLRAYLQCLAKLLVAHGHADVGLDSPSCKLPGAFIDAIPQNIIIGPDEAPSLIDREWFACQGVELGHLLFRGLLLLVDQARNLQPCEEQPGISRRDFIGQLFRVSGLATEDGALERYNALEVEFQRLVTGRSEEALADWHPKWPLVAHDLGRQPHASLYFATADGGFSEVSAVQRSLSSGRQQLRFELQASQGPITALRCDPVDRPQWFIVHDIAIANGQQQGLWRFSENASSATFLETQDVVALPEGLVRYAYSDDPKILLPSSEFSGEGELTIDLDIELLENGEVARKVSQLGVQLGEQRGLIISLQKQIGEMERVMEELRERDARIAELQQEVVCSKTQILEVQKILIERDAQIKTSLELDHVRNQLDASQGKVKEQEEALLGMNSEQLRLNEEKNREIGQLQSSAGSSQHNCDEPERRVAELEQELRLRDERLALLEQEIAGRNQLVNAQTITISDMLRSTSWRLTAPLRYVGLEQRKLKDILTITKSLLQRYPLAFLARKTWHILRSEGLAGVKARVRQQHFLALRPLSTMSSATSSTVPSFEAGNTALVRDSRGRFALAPETQGYTYIEPQRPADLETRLAELKSAPFFSIVVPVYNTPTELLEAVLGSVQAQWYTRWELILVDDASPSKETRQALKRINHSQIKLLRLKENQGIAGATNAGLEAAEGDFIVFMDHDDELTVDCLYELALCIEKEQPDFIYSDEDKLSEQGDYVQPHFKPDWSPDTMMSTMFTCHVSCVRRILQQKVGGLRSEYNGCQDWDFVLRVAEHTERISHIPKVLYHWRIIPASVASDIAAKPYVLEASRRVRVDTLERRGLKGTVEPVEQMQGYFRVKYHLRGAPLISIIIPSRDNGPVLQRCIESIQQKSSYQNFEIIILDNGSVDSDTLIYLQSLQDVKAATVIRHDAPFNFSELNNLGVQYASGELLVFLNDDTEVICADWLERMGGYAQLPHIGAVGAKLLYPGGKEIQHAGVLNLPIGPVHAFLRHDSDRPGYFMRNLLEYNWLAVTGACLMIEAARFHELNGFDTSLPVAYNDIELCFRSAEKGYFNVVCQAATLIHHESVSRGLDHIDPIKMARLESDMARLYEMHPKYFQYDPFHNPNLHPSGINFEVPA